MSLWGSISGLGSGLKDIGNAAVSLGQQALNAADGGSAAADGWGSSELDDVDLADELYGDDSAQPQQKHDDSTNEKPEDDTAGSMPSILASSALGGLGNLTKSLPLSAAANVFRQVKATVTAETTDAEDDGEGEEEDTEGESASSLTGFASRATSSLLHGIGSLAQGVGHRVEQREGEEGPTMAGSKDDEEGLKDVELESALGTRGAVLQGQTGAGEGWTPEGTKGSSSTSMYGGSFAGAPPAPGDVGEVKKLAAALTAAKETAAAEKSRADSFKAHVVKLERSLQQSNEAAQVAEADWHAKLKETNAALKAALAKSDKASISDGLQDRVDLLEAQLAEERSQREDAEAQAQMGRETIAMYKAETQRLQAEVAVLTSRMDDKTSAVSSEQGQSMELTSLQQRVEDMQQLLHTREQAEQRDKQKLEEALHSQGVLSAELQQAGVDLECVRSEMVNMVHTAERDKAAAAKAKAEDEEEIRRLTATVEALQNERTAGSREQQALKEQLSSLQAQVHAIDADRQGLQDTCAKLVAEIEHLKALLEERNEDNERYAVLIEEKSTALALERAALRASEGRVADLESTSQSLKEQVSGLQRQVEQRDATIAGLSCGQQGPSSVTADLQAQLASLTAAVGEEKAAAAQAVQELSQQLQDSEQRLEQSVTVMQDRAEEIERLQEELSTVRAQLSTAQSDLMDHSEDARGGNSQARAARAELDALQQKVQELEQAVQRAEADKDSAEESYTRVDEELVLMKGELRSVAMQLEQAHSELEQARKDAAARKSALSASTQSEAEQVGRVQAELAEVQSRLASAQHEADVLHAKVAQLELQLSQSLEAKEELQVSKDREAEHLKTMHAERVEALQGKVEELQDTLQHVQNEVRVAEAKGAEHERALQAVRASESELKLALDGMRHSSTSIIDELKQKCEVLSTQLQAERGKVAGLQEAVAQAHAAAEQVQHTEATTVTSLQSQLDSAQAELQRVRAELEESLAAGERAVAQMSDLQSQATRAESKAQHAEAQVATLQQQVDAQSAAHEALQSSVSQLQGELRAQLAREEQLVKGRAKDGDRIAELEGLVHSLRASLNDTSSSSESTARDLTSARTEAQGLRAQVQELFKQLEQYRAAVEDAQRDRDESTGIIAELQGQVQTLENLLGVKQSEWTARETSLRGALAQAEALHESMAGVQGEADTLRAALQAKDEELQTLVSSMENLQVIVDTMASGKSASESRELDSVRARDAALARVAELEALLRNANAAGPAAAVPAKPAATGPAADNFAAPPSASPTEVHAKLAQAQVRIAQLQSTVHDLKAALRDTTAMSNARQAQSENETSVDKRLAGALVVAFLSLQRASGRSTGFGSPKARDALQVLASVLGLTQQEKEAVGLKDAVEGASEGQAGALVSSAVGAVGGFLGSFLGSSPAPAAHQGGTVGRLADGGEVPASLGSAFVQFLLEETAETGEGGEASTGENEPQQSAGGQGPAAVAS